MKVSRAAALIATVLHLGACSGGKGCGSLNRANALRTAIAAKDAMLRRSTKAYASNFAADRPTFVKIGSETNGYVANVAFRGRDGKELIALIEEDCYVGWTGD